MDHSETQNTNTNENTNINTNTNITQTHTQNRLLLIDSLQCVCNKTIYIYTYLQTIALVVFLKNIHKIFGKCFLCEKSKKKRAQTQTHTLTQTKKRFYY